MTLRTFPRTALQTGLIVLLMTQEAAAQGTTTDMTLLLTPHCTTTDRSTCASFSVADGQHLKTDKLSAGDILDVDVVVTGLKYAQVETIESWLKYDPAILEARSVESTAAFSAPTPGEQTIDAVLGIVKIGGETKGTLTTSSTAIARVTFRVIASTNNTEVSFFGYKVDGTGQTLVNAAYGKKTDGGVLPPPPCFGDVIGCRGAPNPLLRIHPSALTVILTDQTAGSASFSQSTSSAGQSSSNGSTFIPITTAAGSDSGTQIINPTGVGTLAGTQGPADATNESTAASSFTLLQVQRLRVTSRDTAAFLAWQALLSAETAGYNVYYGTVSGRYIQRRSVASADTSLSIRDLAPGTVYYFAVRGVNASGQESQFSQEVSVTVGQPETSTSPMEAVIPDEPAVEGNPIAIRDGEIIQGETGMGETVLMLLFVSAIIGTSLAFRRQLILTHTAPYGS
ncbi:MAG: cohesin domain-containing protein [Candidatus Peribacteraceae bacterium]|nr:cohesin domain-containing protein [Candidatus Peribacteraceae bacterium]